MTPDAQRIAIAEACGWSKNNEYPVGLDGSRPWANPLYESCWLVYDDWNLPDFLNDLNAMHEAEKRLTEQQEFHYHDELHKLCNKGKRHACYESIRATAAQRAEAFLRTLKLWIND